MGQSEQSERTPAKAGLQERKKGDCKPPRREKRKEQERETKENMEENVRAGIGSTEPQGLVDRTVRYKSGHLTKQRQSLQK